MLLKKVKFPLFKIFPSRLQWRKWSLPGKASYLGAWAGGIGFLITIAIIIVIPLIHPVLDYLSRWPIPKADPNRFSILVAHLENDTNREYDRLIVEALKEFEGIQVLALDRTIPLKGPIPEEEEKRGYVSAHRYLTESGASVLIWGVVLSYGGKTVPKLYWTTSHGVKRKPERYEAPLAETQFRLPEVFWNSLGEILRLLVASYAAEFSAEPGRFVAHRLPPFIARVRTLLEASKNSPGWDAVSRGRTLIILASALEVLGDQSGKSDFLEEAIAVYREALKELTRDRVPLEWAATQTNLGNSLGILGKRKSDHRLMEEAVAAHQEALKELTRDRVPLEWAKTQTNLGTTLWMLGQRESGTRCLEEAVAAHRDALKELTRDKVPLEWAVTQHNLGAALGMLGERESGTRRLKEAVVAFREALKERTRNRVPLDWAATQTNLGATLGMLGEHESGTRRFKEAVVALREALKERTRDRVPLEWAETQN